MAARSQQKRTAMHLEHLCGNFQKIGMGPHIRDASVIMMHLSSRHNYLVHFHPSNGSQLIRHKNILQTAFNTHAYQYPHLLRIWTT